jgi:anti-sigma B factor antagonist
MEEKSGNEMLEREDVGEITLVRITEPMLSSAEAERLFEQLFALVDAGRSRLVLSFANVTFIASMGIGKLVVLMRKAGGVGGRLTICKVHPNIAEALRITRVTDVLLLYNDEQEALESFA